eukprot:2798795-Pyramimonas_sp.AAC.1
MPRTSPRTKSIRIFGNHSHIAEHVWLPIVFTGPEDQVPGCAEDCPPPFQVHEDYLQVHQAFCLPDVDGRHSKSRLARESV